VGQVQYDAPSSVAPSAFAQRHEQVTSRDGLRSVHCWWTISPSWGGLIVALSLAPVLLLGCKGVSPSSSGTIPQGPKVRHGTRLSQPPDLMAKGDITFSPPIPLESPDEALRGVDDQKIVLPQEAVLLLDYPMKDTWAFSALTAQHGWTRAQLVRQVADLYRYVYAEEARTTTTLPGKVGHLENRNETNGTFGICCHDLGDLVLGGIQLSVDSSGKRYLELRLGS
jgi:hypothetical protein